MFSIIELQTKYDADQIRNIPATRQEYHLKGIGLYGQMINTFSECILNDQEPPITLEDGRHSVTVVEAIYRSAAAGKLARVVNC